MTPNRRNFLKTAAGIAAAAFLPFQAPPAQRRQISVGNRRIKVIDVHGHFIAPEELDVIKDTSLASNISNQLNGPLVLGPERLLTLDGRGIDVQVLSHQGGWWYKTDRDLAGRLIKVQNEKLAAWCAAYPDRFVGLASVALQYPDLAVQQLEDAVKKLGFRGVGIAGHAGGEVPSAPKFDLFWAKVQELGVPVFVHPGGAENVLQEGALGGRGDLANIIGNPLETTVFLSRMIFDGTLDRFPRLQLIGAHAGGYLPSYIERTNVACEVRPGANCANKKSPREYFKQQITVDSMVFTPEGLRHLVAELGASRVVFGTDIPFNWPTPADLILGATFLSSGEKESILSGNMTKLLGLTSK